MQRAGQLDENRRRTNVCTKPGWRDQLVIAGISTLQLQAGNHVHGGSNRDLREAGGNHPGLNFISRHPIHPRIQTRQLSQISAIIILRNSGHRRQGQRSRHDIRGQHHSRRNRIVHRLGASQKIARNRNRLTGASYGINILPDHAARKSHRVGAHHACQHRRSGYRRLRRSIVLLRCRTQPTHRQLLLAQLNRQRPRPSPRCVPCAHHHRKSPHLTRGATDDSGGRVQNQTLRQAHRSVLHDQAPVGLDLPAHRTAIHTTQTPSQHHGRFQRRFTLGQNQRMLTPRTHTPHHQPVANLPSQSRHRTSAVHLRSISQLTHPIPTPSIHHPIFSQSQAVLAASHHRLQVHTHSHRSHRNGPLFHAPVTQLA